MVSGIDHDRHIEGAEVLLDQRLHFVPIQPADAGREARQGDAGEIFRQRKLVQLTQRMAHVVGGGLAWLRAVLVGGVLGEEIDDALAGRAHP